VGCDIQWYDWSGAFKELPITLSNPTDPIVGAILGPQYREGYPLNWDDSVSYRFAYEWSPTEDVTWRTGYVYHNSPVPNSTLSPYLDGILEHVVSLGCSRCVGGAWLNVAYQFSWSPERVVTDSTIVGNDFDNSTMKAQAHWLSVGYIKPY
jgi:long-subunit fatty acid transport protein